MQIELLKPRKLRNKKGEVREYKPGEIIDFLRNNTANTFIKQGIARKASHQEVVLSIKRLPIVQGFEFIHDRQVYWDGTVQLKESRIDKGLALLDTWEMVAPLYDTLIAARSGKDEAERTLTEGIIRDLRVPVYETGIVFLRRCEATITFLHLWRDEKLRGDSPLAFLRALYVAQPLIYALPSAWLNL